MKKLTVIGLLVGLMGCSQPESVTVYDIDNHPIAVSGESDHWTVINYWANWCSPCITEIPELNKLSQQFGEKVKVLAVNPEQTDKQTLKEHAQTLNIQYAVLQSDPGPALGLQPVHALPATYLISPAGKIKGPFLGAQTVAGLTKEMAFEEKL